MGVAVVSVKEVDVLTTFSKVSFAVCIGVSGWRVLVRVKTLRKI